MRVIVLGAGIIGVSTAWYLLDQGHDVTVVDRQPGAALETSFANGAQISVGFCEPWANAEAPLKVLKWLARDDSPLLFRPKLDVAHVLGPGRMTNARREFLFHDNGWGEYAARVDVHEVPGDHDSMVLEPNVRVLANKLQKCIRSVEPGPSRPRVQEERDVAIA